MTLLLAAILAMPALAHSESQAVGNYSRTETTYTVRNGGNSYHVANRLVGDDNEALRNHVAREVALLNDAAASHRWDEGKGLRVPRYRASEGRFCGDLRNWYHAVRAGETWGVCPALLIGIRSLENPDPKRDWYAYGVKGARNQGSLSKQANAAARALSRYKVTWDPRKPTREALGRVGRIYCPPNAKHWQRTVWTLRQRALSQ